MGSRPTISHTFLALPSQWMSSSSRESERGIGSRLHFIVFVIGVNQKNQKAGVQNSLVET